ncbi:MAG: 23S rRNA (cytosine(1962)-C(5))-methyltransferase RlmI, partial [bacterium (Candidatus Stahlbacteria) CG23_combo_of_CG06-09_8_20_14_all_34_7]
HSRVEVDREFFIQRFHQIENMKKIFLSDQTNMYRLCFSEADFIPGLIVDNYNGNLVIQTNSAGVIRKRNMIVEALESVMKPISIIDRTDAETYSIEHCEKSNSSENILYGNLINDILLMKENNVLFYVDLKNGHKTGFYLDQRENRELIGKISSQKNVLNLCSYTGGFTLYALLGGASSSVSVDTSEKALDLLKRNIEVNKIDHEKNKNIKEDMFEYVTNYDFEKFDIVIIDPPAFAKHISESRQAEKAYKYINSTVLKKVKPETFILTSSCTSVVNFEMFSEILEKSIRDSRRDVKIIKKRFLPSDHPALFHFKETEYLKSFLLYVL